MSLDDVGKPWCLWQGILNSRLGHTESVNIVDNSWVVEHQFSVTLLEKSWATAEHTGSHSVVVTMITPSSVQQYLPQCGSSVSPATAAAFHNYSATHSYSTQFYLLDIDNTSCDLYCDNRISARICDTIIQSIMEPGMQMSSIKHPKEKCFHSSSIR